MTSKVIQRAKIARKFGVALVAAGLAPILWSIVTALRPLPPAWMADTEALLPTHRMPWIAHPTLLLFGLAGLALIWLGATIVGRQSAVFQAEQRAAEDRLRRVREYGDDGRIEPFIGSTIEFPSDTEPR
jgi:hypothetical protein